MVREETLRAIISARERLSAAMRDAAEGTRDLRNSMVEAALQSSSLVGSLDVAESELDEYERAVAQVGREATVSAIEQEFLEQGIDDAGEAAIEAAGAMELYEIFVDEAGDEARETAAENFGLAASLRAVGAAAGEASVNVGPFNTSVRRAIVALPVLIGLVGSFTTVLLGVAGAAGAASGALAALFAGGILGRAQQLARTSSEIEGTGEALERIFTEVASSIDEATEPIQDIATQQAALDTLKGLVTLSGDLADSAAYLSSTFAAVEARLAPTFWAEEARGIAEVEESIMELMPILEDLTFYVLANLPDFIAWVREETERVAPAMGDFFTSLVPVTRELIEISGTLLRLTLPALSLLLDMLVPVIGTLEAVPDPAIAAAAAFAVTSAALVAYAGSASLAAAATGLLEAALAPVIAILGTISAPITLSIALIAALVAAIVGLVTWLDLWDDIVNVIIATWNGLINIIEFAVNAFVNLSRGIEEILGPLTLLIPIIGTTMWLIANWGDVVQAVTRFIDGMTRAWEDFVTSVMKYVDPVLKAMRKVEEQVDKSGGVSLEGAKIDEPSATAEGGPSRRGGDDRMAGAGPRVRDRTREIESRREEVVFDFSGSEFNGDTTQADVERAVERALEKQRSRSSDT